MADPVDEDLRALGVTDADEDEDLKALGVADATPEPTPTTPPMSVGAPYHGPELRAPERSTWNTLRDVAEASGTVPRGIIPDEGTARGAVASILQGPTLNWADEAAGLIRASDPKSLWDPKVKARIDERASAYVAGGMEPDAARQRAAKDVFEIGGDLYRDGRDTFRNVEGAFRKEHPAAALALTAVSGAASGGPFRRLGGLSKYLPAVGEGILAGTGAAAEQEDIPLAAMSGGALSYSGAWAGEKLGNLFRSGTNKLAQSSLVTGVVKPSKAAQYLESKGVDTLSTGQLAPGSGTAQLEEVATSVGGVGPTIQSFRDAGREGWQRAVLNEALPPGMQPLPKGVDGATAIRDMSRAFDNAYEFAKGHPISPETVQKVLDEADNRMVYASDQSRQTVFKFLKDQMTALHLRDDGMVDSGDVINLRRFLRERIRDLQNGTDADSVQARDLLKKAVGVLTDGLDNELPQDAARALKATDMQYAKFRTVADAVARSKDAVGGVTPTHLQNAVSSATPREMYEMGGGGALRQMSSAGKTVLDSRSPVTGARLLATGPGMKWVNAAAMYAANQPTGRALMMGTTPLQQSIQQSAPNAGAMLGDAVSSLGPAAAYAQRNAVEAPERRDTTTSDVVSGLVQSNPEALGPYATQLEQAAADGTLPLVHYTLQQKDPQYRRMLDTIRSGGTQ